MYEFLRYIGGGGSVGEDRRLRELWRVALNLGFIREDGSITERGFRFVSAYEKGDGGAIHELFMEALEPYRVVYGLVSKGVMQPSELVTLSGFNAVVVDVVLRLIREVEALGTSMRGEVWGLFEKVLFDKYRELTRRRWSKYVTILDLLEEVKRELRFPRRVVEEMFREFVRRRKGDVVLTGSPAGDVAGFEIGGRRYVYIMLKT
ncbi:MAG: hypothetical protein ACO2O1_09220 [Candidatus Caldarchaeales archaeon]